MATPWWVDRPGTLHEELQALERAGITFHVREDLKAQGILQIEATVEVNGETIEVEVVYPDFFPYVRFEVFAPNLDLPRHQNPFLKNLCLIARATENWNIDDTAAGFLIKRLPMVLAAARAPIGESPVPEVPQGEPMSAYYGGTDGAMLLIDSAWSIPDEHERGWLKVALDPSPVGTASGGGIDAPVLRGVVVEVQGAGHDVLARADDPLVGTICHPVIVTGRWVRIDPPPTIGPPPDGLNDLASQIDSAWGGAGTKVSYGRDKMELAGVVFREEVAEGVFGDGWIFRIRTFGRGRLANQHVSYLARAGRAGRDDLASRTPELLGLRDKTALIVGLGGVGTPAAIELARAGIYRLRLVDPDFVDPGTAVRYPLGMASAGQPKVHAIAEWIGRNLPYTIVEPYTDRIGNSRRNPGERSEIEVWDELLADVDIVVDATAEVGFHYLISDLARARGIPYAEAATRTGAWGGVLARISGDAGAPCWLCYQFFLEDLRSATPPIAPSADPAGMKQPLGCADPTFTGAGFDVAEYGLALARLVAGTLLEDSEGAYPSPGWDVAIYNLRDESGAMTAHTWQTWPLEIHAKCPKHGS